MNRYSRNAGFSLVELMVAIVIALLLTAGIIQLFVSNKQGYRVQEGLNLMNENARFTLAEMKYDLRMADHWGGAQPDSITSIAPAVTGDCSAGYATDNVGLQGYDGGANVPADLNGCIAAGNYVKDSDVLVLRYAGAWLDPTKAITQTITSDPDANQRLYLRVATGRHGQIFKGDNEGALDADLADPTPALLEPFNIQNYPYEFVAYFLRPCSSQSAGTAGVCDAGDDTTPTLTRLRLNRDTAECTNQGMASPCILQEDIAQGVEQMRILYGLDNDGNGSADTYVRAADVNVNDWPSVISVRFELLLRSSEFDLTVDESGEVYPLIGGDYTIPADSGSFRHKLYSSTVQLRNQSRS